MDIFDKLKRPFPAKQIHWRIGARTGDKSKGIALAYIDARNVMRRLDEVVGPANWQCRYPLAADGLLICEIGIWVEDRKEWLWRANGAGDTQVEAEKGKASDAFKRAAVMWGIGQYLYSLPNTWVPLESGGKKLAQQPQLPTWATPEGYDDILAKRGETEK
jgi:hypothetical protein